jgi:hypothetical protein
MTLAFDVQLHQNPRVGSLLLYWLAEGHAEERPDGSGILLPWAMLALGLLSTDDAKEGLPKSKATFSGWLGGEGSRAWRGDVRGIILAWRDAFWHAAAVGVQSGILAVRDARVCAAAKPSITSAQSIAGQLRRRARALGGTIGSERSDHTIASALGLEFVP